MKPLPGFVGGPRTQVKPKTALLMCSETDGCSSCDARCGSLSPRFPTRTLLRRCFRREKRRWRERRPRAQGQPGQGKGISSGVRRGGVRRLGWGGRRGGSIGCLRRPFSWQREDAADLRWGARPQVCPVAGVLKPLFGYFRDTQTTVDALLLFFVRELVVPSISKDLSRATHGQVGDTRGCAEPELGLGASARVRH